mgnify:CR=1 FL=1
MIEEYFNLSRAPFKLSTDADFYFDSDRHRKALSYLQYGLQQGEGIIVVTGKSGVGKSMLIEQFVLELDHEAILAAVIAPGPAEQDAILSHVLSGFKIEAKKDGLVAQSEALRDYLADQQRRGRQNILIVDEAQNLSPGAIEEIRHLTNYAHGSQPLLQVFLIGHSSLKDVLRVPEMEHLRQRVVASTELRPLGADEVADYIAHRMTVSGWHDTRQIFTDNACRRIFDLTDGIPRKINKLCSRLMLQAALDNQKEISSAIVEKVIADLSNESLEMVKAPTGPVEQATSGSVASSATSEISDMPLAGGDNSSVSEDDTATEPPVTLDDLAEQITAHVEQDPVGGTQMSEDQTEQPVDGVKAELQQMIADMQSGLVAVEDNLAVLRARLAEVEDYRKGRNKLIANHLKKIDSVLLDMMAG